DQKMYTQKTSSRAVIGCYNHAFSFLISHCRSVSGFNLFLPLWARLRFKLPGLRSPDGRD
ncbi:MAG: hypothetical protein ACXWMH_05760, partial [Syntrophales bacterium]